VFIVSVIMLSNCRNLQCLHQMSNVSALLLDDTLLKYLFKWFCATFLLLNCLSITTVCIEYDECQTKDHGCQHICVNTIGGYRCECKIGYELNPDGRTCEGRIYAPGFISTGNAWKRRSHCWKAAGTL